MIGSGQPTSAALVKTYNPFLLFNIKASQDFTVRIKYLSSNVGMDSTGQTPLSAFTAADDLPMLPREYHRLLMLLTAKLIAERLAVLRDQTGEVRFPGMVDAFKVFSSEYEAQLKVDMDDARRRSITRNTPAFDIAGSGLWILNTAQKPRR